MESCDVLTKPNSSAGPGQVPLEAETIVSHPLTIVLRLPRHAIWKKRRILFGFLPLARSHRDSRGPSPTELCSSSHVRICGACSWSSDSNSKQQSLAVNVSISRKGDELDNVCVDLPLRVAVAASSEASSTVSSAGTGIGDKAPPDMRAAQADSATSPKATPGERDDEEIIRVRLDTKERCAGFASKPEHKEVVYTEYFDKHLRIADTERNYFLRVVKVRAPFWKGLVSRLKPRCTCGVVEDGARLPIVVTEELCEGY